MRRILALLVLLASILTAAPATLAQAAPSACQFRLGFAALDALIRTPVGACLEDENHNPKNGDGLQHTTGGLMVWRKSDNWTAFTDGYHTWINGPNGLQERLNDQLFVWEKAEQAQAPTSTLLDQSGTGQATTDIFNPKGSFAVAYSFDCTSRGEGIFQITSRVPNSRPRGRSRCCQGAGYVPLHHGRAARPENINLRRVPLARDRDWLGDVSLPMSLTNPCPILDGEGVCYPRIGSPP
jgi:hypothetical protein